MSVVCVLLTVAPPVSIVINQLNSMGDLVLLRLQQLFDSQFPVGSFAHSSGLETYAHLPFGPHDLAELLAHNIELGWGRLDLAAAALAWEEEEHKRLEHLAQEVDAWKVIPGLRLTSLRLGQRTLMLAQRLWPAFTLKLEPSHQPVVIGSLGRWLALPVRQLLLLYAQSTLTASLAAATRCLPLSPGQAQELLVALQPKLAGAVARVLANPQASLFSATPAMDLRAAEQAQLYTRLFQS